MADNDTEKSQKPRSRFRPQVQRPWRKVSAEDLDAALAARRSAAATSRQRTLEEATAGLSPAQRVSYRRRGIAAGVLALGAATCLVLTGLGTSDYHQTLDTRASVVSNLEREVAVSAPRAANPQQQVDTAKKDVATVTSLAREVADEQNEFGRIAAANPQSAARNGVPGPGYVKAAAHRRDLARYFTPDSLVVEGEVAYQANSAPLFEATEIDPRFSWYVKYDGAPGDKDRTPADPAGYGWHLASVQPTEETGHYRVRWTCTDTDGRLLAWAAATYIPEATAFGQLSVGQTTYGDRATVLAQGGR